MFTRLNTNLDFEWIEIQVENFNELRGSLSSEYSLSEYKELLFNLKSSIKGRKPWKIRTISGDIDSIKDLLEIAHETVITTQNAGDVLKFISDHAQTLSDKYFQIIIASPFTNPKIEDYTEMKRRLLQSHRISVEIVLSEVYLSSFPNIPMLIGKNIKSRDRKFAASSTKMSENIRQRESASSSSGD
jgi:hypothetical protein